MDQELALPARLSAAIVLAGVLALAGPAAGQPAADRAAFQAEFDRGIALYQAGDYAAASAALEAAYRIDAQPDVAFALAQALRLAGDCAGALVYYRGLLDDRPSAARRTAIETAMTPCVQAETASRKRREDAVGERPAPEVTPVGAVAEVAVAPRARAPRWYADPLGTTLVAAGAVGLGFGIAGLGLASGSYADAEAASSESAYLDALESGDRWRTLGAVGLVAGGALATVGVVRWVVVARSGRTESIALGPDPRGGVWIAGSF